MYEMDKDSNAKAENEIKIDKDFYSTLEKKYVKEFKDKGKEEWDAEKEDIRKIIPIIGEKIKERYEITKPLNVGGTSIIILIFDKVLKITSALKFPRPQIQKISAFAEIIDKEKSILIKAKHPYIVQIYDHDEIEHQFNDFSIKKVIPYYIMEYIEGAVNLEEFLINKKNDEEKIKRVDISKAVLFRILQQITYGICRLHELDIVHLDIKLENMLISPDGNAKLSDLGSGRQLFVEKEDPETLIEIILDDRWAHPDLVEEFRGLYRSEHARTRGKIKRKNLKTVFDRYAFGKNIHRLLKFYEPGKWKNFELYDKHYLELLACRLLDSQHKANETGLGLPCEHYREINYDNIQNVIVDLQKITGEYSIYLDVPEMNPFNEATLQTANIRATPFTKRLKKVIECTPFLRLGYVSQLGFINLLYPTATHSRLEHMLGTYSNVVRYCDALYNDPFNPVFKQIMNESDIKAVLLAALFHDLGQYPLAHDLEESEPLFSHEDLTEYLLTNPEHNKELKKLLDYIERKEDKEDKENGRDEQDKESWGISVSRIISIIKADPNDIVHNFSIKDRILHTLIDCPIDADKLDYIIRDSNNLGLKVGYSIDLERFFKTITIIFGDKKGKNHLYASLGIHEKGKVQAESLAFSRYILFNTVYWHHTSRAIKGMLHQAVWEIFYGESGKRKEIVKKDLYDLITQNIQTPEKFSSDYDMLDWISDQTSVPGRQLLEKIKKRQLFKRLLVISKRGNMEIWKQFYAMRDSWWTGDRSLALQQEFQKQIIEYLDKIQEPELEKLKISKENIQKIVKRHNSNEILFLIDIPKVRGSQHISLEYLPESDHLDIRESWNKPHTFGESGIWSYLTHNFIELVGKIRVFVDPSIRITVKMAIPQNIREQLLVRSISNVRKNITHTNALIEVIGNPQNPLP